MKLQRLSWDSKLDTELREKIITALCVTSFFSLTLFLFGPSYLYFTNTLEFSFLFSEVFYYFLAISLFCILLITILLLPLKFSVYQKIVSLLFALSFLSWFQGNVLVWNYGLLDGRDINWNKHFVKGLIDGGIWLLFMIVAFIKSPSIYKIIRKASVAFILIQLISVSIVAMKAPGTPSFKRYSIDETNKFNFSPEKNVIILVLDSFQTDVFQEIIDEDSYYKDIFDGFTYFRNALGGYPTTYGSIPLILTGKYYDNSIPMQEYIKKQYLSNSIPLVLKKNGYQIDLFLHKNDAKTIYFDAEVMSNIKKRDKNANEIAWLYDITFFRYMPQFIKKHIYNEQKWLLTQIIQAQSENDKPSSNVFSEEAFKFSRDIRFIDTMISQSVVKADRYTFKFYHLRGVHNPFILNDKLKYQRMAGDRSGYKTQAKASLKITKMFFEKLKHLNIYNNSMILVIADHGFPSGEISIKIPEKLETETNTPNYIPDYVKGPALPLILAKPFTSIGEMDISDAPVSLSDIPKTIFSELGLDGDFSGYSMFKVKESETRERRYLSYQWQHGYWRKEYLPPMKEYIVSGFSWTDKSWKPTYFEYTPEGVKKYVPYKIYQFGENIQFNRGGNSLQYAGNGWSQQEQNFTWTNGKMAFLNIPINSPKSDLILKASLSPYLAGGKLTEQRVGILVNGGKIGNWKVNKEGEYQIIIPKNHVKENLLRITFELPDAVSPFEIGMSDDIRKLAIAMKTLVLEEMPH